MSRTVLSALGIAACLTLAPAPFMAQASAQTAAARPTDDVLQDRVERQLELSPVIKKYDIKAKVTGGVATLSGTVATDAQKAEAARLARVPGVGSVTNQIAVDKTVDQTLTERMKTGVRKTGEAITDAWITTKVKWFYTGDDMLKGSDINVDTSNRVVTLKGTVSSAAARKHANDLARQTEGVTRVVDELVIKGAKGAK